MSARRVRLGALVGALAVLGSVLVAAAPAQAFTFDGPSVRETFRFTVAGRQWTLQDRSIGSATRTIHVGRTSGEVAAHYRLTFEDPHGRTVRRVERGLEQQAWILNRFADRRFASPTAFRAAEHRALTVPRATARAAYAKQLRILSVQSDLEATIAATSDYVDALPQGAVPDFAALRTVKSSEYPGSATVSGTARKDWTATVRDTRDGYGEFFDGATGGEGVFRF